MDKERLVRGLYETFASVPDPRSAQGQRSVEVRYAITSLGSEVGARQLLGLVRGQWAIENRLHWVRDVTMGKDASQV